VENKLLLSSDMGRITTLVLFTVLPCSIRLYFESKQRHTEGVVTISLGWAIVLYIISNLSPKQNG